MRISKIEFENFRNFRDHGEITCSTDGRITVIYGKNGDGKTTLHQLFQWVFYGQVQFNKTATDKLYNLSYESEQPFGSVFKVLGRIDFEHDGEKLSITRTNTYRKSIDSSEKISEELSLNKMDSDHNWKRVERPADYIEKVLPSGLSDYFFFDGESMIADLRVKGKDAADKLRKALYSMFDLDIIESALNHIGRTDLRTSALGKLYSSKGTSSSSIEIQNAKQNIDNAILRRDNYQARLDAANADKERCKEIITNVSEQIGGSKSKAQYEARRKELKSTRDLSLRNADSAMTEFGDAVMATVPQLFISKAVEDAKKKIHLKIEESNLPEGLTKGFIEYLLKDTTTECICGHPLSIDDKKVICEYLKMFPPYSYKKLYNDFSSLTQRWGKIYNREELDGYISRVFENNQLAEKCDADIRELDEAEKKAPDIEELVIAREKAENEINTLDDSISNIQTEIKKLNIYIKKQSETYDALTRATENGKQIQERIDILQMVANEFKTRLTNESNLYSNKLELNIQDLLNAMLTSKRTVSVSNEFAVRVTDSFDDESKSEGQFAVVSFAYIGGILKMLKSEDRLANKEYPLVLDGPFSKLDPDQRQNVIDTIPSFAPQIILFSKDDLSSLIGDNALGRVWTIKSNEEKNIAHIEEGYLWN